MNKGNLLASIIIGAIVSAVAAVSLRYFLALDACLDRGGFYNKAENSCALIPGGYDAFYVTLDNASMLFVAAIALAVSALAAGVSYWLFGIIFVVNNMYRPDARPDFLRWRDDCMLK